MSDIPTDVPGVVLRRIRGQTYVVFYPSRIQTTPTIAWLSQYLRLQPETALDALLRYGLNRVTVRALHRDYIRGIDDRFPGLAQARRELRTQGYNVSAIQRDGRIYVTQMAFLIWRLNLEQNQYVLLPLSQDFRDVMRQATARRSRQARIRTATPAFTALEGELRQIRSMARLLDSDIGLFRRLTEQSARDIALLEALDGLIGVLLRFPKSSSVDATDLTDLQSLRTRLNTLKQRAYQDMMHNPPDSLRQNLVRNRDQHTAELMRFFEDSDFVEHIQTLVNNRDIAPAALWTDTADTLRQAATVLLVSPQADQFIDNHVIPLIDTLASRSFDIQGLSAPHHPHFERAVLNPPSAPSSTNSALVIFGGLAGTMTLTIGNLPGPSSLSVAALEMTAPTIMGRIMESALRTEPAGRYGGRMYRALANSADLTQAERVELIQAIDQGDLNRLRRVNWTNRFMNSPAWGSALGVASALCLIVAIRVDDASTVRYWSNILGSASGTAIGVSVALQRYSTLLRNGIVRGIGGRVLGVIGGVTAIISGGVTAMEEYQTRDRVGMGIAIAGAAGGALSVAGFLIATGAATAAVGGVGCILMLAGIIIGIGAGVVALIRQLTTTGSHMIFEAFVNHFATRYEYTHAAQSRASLRQAFEIVQRSHHGIDFWDANPDKIPELCDLGFGVGHIAQIVDENESVVRRALLTANREVR